MASSTGRRRHRRNWRGKLILQVEEVQNHTQCLGGSGHFEDWQTVRWRDAKLSDLHEDVA